MALVKTDLFTIDDEPMFAPDSGVEISFEDIDSPESGRSADGSMHRVVVAYDVGTWKFTYFAMSEAEYAYMRKLFRKKPDFRFGHPDLENRSQKVVTRAYRSKHGISWENAVTGEFRNHSFSIVECGDGDDSEVAYV